MTKDKENGRSNHGETAPARTRRGANTRQKVLDAARACLSEKGYALTSSNEIARRAGVSWGVIQHHYGTRQAILLELLEDLVSQIEQRIEGIEIQGHTDEERLMAAADAVCEYFTDANRTAYHEVYINLVRAPDTLPETRARLTALNDRANSLWAAVLKPLFGAYEGGGVMERLLVHALWGVTLGTALDASSNTEEEKKLLVSALTLQMRAEGKRS